MQLEWISPGVPRISPRKIARDFAGTIFNSCSRLCYSSCAKAVSTADCWRKLQPIRVPPVRGPLRSAIMRLSEPYPTLLSRSGPLGLQTYRNPLDRT